MNQIEAFRHYLEIEERRTPATVRAYLADVRQLRAWLDRPDQPERQRGRDWDLITAADLRGFLASTKPGPHRVHRLIASWVKFWSFLRDVQHVPVGNPPGELKRPKLPGRLPKYLETEDVARLLQAAHEDKNTRRALRNWAFLAFLFGTGARISEVLGLTFDRVTLVDGLPVSVRVIGKGDKERTIPLSGTAQTALAQWLRVRRTEGHPTSRIVWSHLDGRNRGKAFPLITMQKMVKATAQRAGLDPAKVSAHKLRHSFATALVERGRGLHEIGTLMGHENPATTAIYGRVKARQLEQAAAALPDVL